MGARPAAGAGETAGDRQVRSCFRGAASPGGETGFNNDSHNHLNTTMLNRTRGTRGGLRGMTRLTWFGAQERRANQAEGAEFRGPKGGWEATGGEE